jgi:membrane fusion protein (multidrug efflux system)
MAGCHSKKKEESGKKEDKPVIVDVVVAYPESVANVIEANGSVVANEYVELHPEISGRLTFLMFQKVQLLPKVRSLPKFMMAICRHNC